MIWVGVIVYLAIGAAIVAWMCGSSKMHNGWSARQAWDQVSSEGWSGSILWWVIIVAWFPLAAFFFGRYAIWKAMGKPL